MKTIFLIIGLFLNFSPCFSQKDLLPAFTNEISYKGERAYFNGEPFTGVLVDAKTSVKWGKFRNGYKIGLFTEYYPNGKKKSEGNFKNGLKEGVHIDWYENGQKKREQSFNNGFPFKFLEWSERGNLLKEGLDNGRFVTYYENGNKEITGGFVNGKLQGFYRKYYKNGKLKSKEYYKHGKLDGTCTYWDLKGNVNTYIYEDGLYIKPNTGNKENYVGYYNSLLPDGVYKSVDDILYYKSNTAKITSVNYYVNDVFQDADYYGLTFKGGQRKDQILKTILIIEGFNSVENKFSYSISIFTSYKGEEFDKRENLDWISTTTPSCVIDINYNTPSFTSARGSSAFIFYCSFYIKDKNSDAMIQGFYKYTMTR